MLIIDAYRACGDKRLDNRRRYGVHNLPVSHLEPIPEQANIDPLELWRSRFVCLANISDEMEHLLDNIDFKILVAVQFDDLILKTFNLFSGCSLNASEVRVIKDAGHELFSSDVELVIQDRFSAEQLFLLVVDLEFPLAVDVLDAVDELIDELLREFDSFELVRDLRFEIGNSYVLVLGRDRGSLAAVCAIIALVLIYVVFGRVPMAGCRGDDVPAKQEGILPPPARVAVVLGLHHLALIKQLLAYEGRVLSRVHQLVPPHLAVEEMVLYDPEHRAERRLLSGEVRQAFLVEFVPELDHVVRARRVFSEKLRDERTAHFIDGDDPNVGIVACPSVSVTDRSFGDPPAVLEPLS